jgi:hypothetical protein
MNDETKCPKCGAKGEPDQNCPRAFIHDCWSYTCSDGEFVQSGKCQVRRLTAQRDRAWRAIHDALATYGTHNHRPVRVILEDGIAADRGEFEAVVVKKGAGE